MIKYRLKKDLPDCKTGTILDWSEECHFYLVEKNNRKGNYSHYHTCCHHLDKETVELSPEWFEKVEEPQEKKWTDRDMYDFAMYCRTYNSYNTDRTAIDDWQRWKIINNTLPKC